MSCARCTLFLITLVLLPGLAATAGVRLEPVAEGLVRPVDVGHAGDGSGRLFIALQSGQILVHDGEKVLEEPFLDISRRVSCCGGRGILGMAFHPRHEENGLVYVAFTDRKGAAVVSRFWAGPDEDRVDPTSEIRVIAIEQAAPGHGNGDIAFGPDGYLYIATGDGSAGGDPDDLAQNLGSLSGKILRLDVDAAIPYRIPPDNPFVGVPDAREEIWAYGLRYPWRFSVDRATGDLYIADVGEKQREEVNVQSAASDGGENYGWRRMEGSACFEPPTDCEDASFVLPAIEYDHDVGCSVIGGFRYRGPEVPTLPRFYLYGDFCAGRVWGARADSAGRWRSVTLARNAAPTVSFGEDEDGNLYLVRYAGEEPAGAVYRLVGEPLFASGFEGGGLDDWRRVRGAVEIAEPGLKRSARALELTADGTRRRSFVEAEIGWSQAIFAVGFVLDVGEIDVGIEGLEILRLLGPRHHTSLALSREGGRYFVSLWTREGEGALKLFGKVRVPAASAVRLELEWFRASGREATDGEIRLAKNGHVKVVAAGLANGSYSIQSLRLGMPGGSEHAGVGGRILFDDLSATP